MDNQMAVPIFRISDRWVQIYVDFDWLIKAGRLKPSDRIDIDDVAQEWGVPGEVVSMAVGLLVTEGRARRCPDGGYLVAPPPY